MAREVRHEANGPAAIDGETLEDHDGSVHVCQCGLSDDRPFCDGSHETTTDEANGAVYKYEGNDADAPRHVIEEIVFVDSTGFDPVELPPGRG